MATNDWPAERRAYLYGVACLRRYWDELSATERAAVEAVERFAELEATKGDLWTARRAVPDGGRLAEAARHLTYTYRTGSNYSDIRRQLVELARDRSDGPGAAAEQSAHDKLLTDISGRPMSWVFDPRWRTPTVEPIAASIYAARAFDQIPILADAVEDAGCDAADLLAHLRGTGPHARGC